MMAGAIIFFICFRVRICIRGCLLAENYCLSYDRLLNNMTWNEWVGEIALIECCDNIFEHFKFNKLNDSYL